MTTKPRHTHVLIVPKYTPKVHLSLHDHRRPEEHRGFITLKEDTTIPCVQSREWIQFPDHDNLGVRRKKIEELGYYEVVRIDEKTSSRSR